MKELAQMSMISISLQLTALALKHLGSLFLEYPYFLINHPFTFSWASLHEQYKSIALILPIFLSHTNLTPSLLYCINFRNLSFSV